LVRADVLLLNAGCLEDVWRLMAAGWREGLGGGAWFIPPRPLPVMPPR